MGFLGIGSILHKVLDPIGLSKVASVLTIAADVYTGNWAEAAGEVFSLTSEFSSSSSWQNSVSQQPPLGSFDKPGGFSNDSLSQLNANDSLSQLNANDIEQRLQSHGVQVSSNVSMALHELDQYQANTSRVNDNQLNAYLGASR